jgi:transcriptional regulator with XRE-family HTH domain
MTEEKMSLSIERVKQLRKDRKALQKHLAELLNITERQYRAYEAGKVDPPTSKTIALADYFNVSIDYLVGRSDDPSRH